MADISIINKDNTDYNVKDAAGRLALAEVENKGAKNRFLYGDLIGITDNFSDKPLSLPAGEYKLMFVSTASSGAFAIRLKDSEGNSIFYITANNAAITRIYDVTITTDAAKITVYSSVSNNFTNFMVCTKEEWDISKAYVPYGKTNAELTTLEQQDRDGLATAIDKGAKNVADISKSSFTANEKDGVTVTLSGDTITATGTSGTSINQFHRILYNGDDLLIPPGTWIAALIGTGTDAFRIEVFATGYSDLVKGTYGSTVEFTILDNATTSYLRITQKPSTNCTGTFKLLITTKEEWDISKAYVPYGKTNAELTVENASQQSEINYAVNAGAKNLLKVTAKSGSSYGLTREVYDDGTITLTTGQAQNNPTLVGVSSEIVIPKGNWILSGCPSGGSDSTYRLDVRRSGTATVLAEDTGGGGTLTLSEDTTCSVFIRVAYNYSVSNLVFKPMIRPAAITDPTFQPYARTNRELTVLTDEDRASLVEIVDGGAKNKFDPASAWDSKTAYGITITRNGDTYSIASGTTQSGDNNFINMGYQANTNLLPAGDWVLSFDTPQQNVCFQVCWDGSLKVNSSFGNNCFFTVPKNTTNSWFRILLRGSTDMSGTSFKIMLCSRIFWEISQAYQNYRPSWQEMYERIIALENQNT